MVSRACLSSVLALALLTASFAGGCGASEGSPNAADAGIQAAADAASGPGPDDASPTARFTVSAAVVGLEGHGLVLHDVSGASVTVAPAPGGAAQTGVVVADVPAQTSYDVSVRTQPTNPLQECVVSGGKGTIVA